MNTDANAPGDHHVCPVWVGHLLASPVRKLLQDPRKILAPHVAPDMRVLDIGCAMGFFSLPLARLVGAGGRVVCVDLQQGMLDALMRRAHRAGLDGTIEPRLCASESLGINDLAGQVDFAMAFAVVHEVPDAARFFAEVHAVLKPGSRFLFAEPKAHVSASAFRRSVVAAEAAGFHMTESEKVWRSHAAILQSGGGAGWTQES